MKRESLVIIFAAFLFTVSMFVLLTSLFGMRDKKIEEIEANSQQKEAKADHVVEIKRFAFKPGIMVVNKDEIVEFVNLDGIEHSATSDKIFDTGLLKPDQKQMIKFETPGVYEYYSVPYPYIKGTITVK